MLFATHSTQPASVTKSRRQSSSREECSRQRDDAHLDHCQSAAVRREGEAALRMLGAPHVDGRPGLQRPDSHSDLEVRYQQHVTAVGAPQRALNACAVWQTSSSI